ncbi:MAG TPA: acetoacetate decarboxylase family protein [Thermodesulfobacteriota bacterium]|nr:acetoacetate decarboxylase family protein [Thermodesulfobacteriota bacterium]
MRLKRRVALLIISMFLVCTLIYRGTAQRVSAQEIEPLPAPQLVTDAWMLLIGFETDPEAIESVLPPGLEPHPNNMLVMNMYTVPEASQTSGFGAYTLTYITVQVKDQDSYTMASSHKEPGRYFTYYFNSSEIVRNFTKQVGIPAEPGVTKQTKQNGKLTSVLEVDGKPFIEATADVGEELQPAAGGHLNYFGLRRIQKDGSEVTQIIKFPIPYVVRTVNTANPTVTFKTPADHALSRLKPTKIVWASYMKGSFVYPQAQILQQFESPAKD